MTLSAWQLKYLGVNYSRVQNIATSSHPSTGSSQIKPLPYLHVTASVTASNLPTLQAILNPILVAVMSSIEASTKNGEKARRVLSEGFRAIRTLVLAYPSQVIATLTSEEYIGRIAFFAKYLCSPTKPLRDNAALLLSAIAFGITGTKSKSARNGFK
jgi:hypothetical protein